MGEIYMPRGGSGGKRAANCWSLWKDTVTQRTEQSTITLFTTLALGTFSYANSYKVERGQIVLVNPTTVTSSSTKYVTLNGSELIGKYVKSGTTAVLKVTEQQSDWLGQVMYDGSRVDKYTYKAIGNMITVTAEHQGFEISDDPNAHTTETDSDGTYYVIVEV